MPATSTSDCWSAIIVAPSVTMLKLCVLATLVGTASAVFYTKSGDAEVPMLGKRSPAERGRLTDSLAVERRRDAGQLPQFAHRLASVLLHRIRQSETLQFRRKQLIRLSTHVGGAKVRLWKRLVLFQKIKRNIILNDLWATQNLEDTDESRPNTSLDRKL